ncbi:MAG TPA: 7-cyano-7-deazaguanine synthase QueC [Candidatus Marinimicrobia bacterium]|jgi:7-cyano-7-deazaguanine synthase|nr:7-cyano-7-deazaguanine synthase QueC [Candidatus Neomarinimicrobiota bacterium]|tara:strand:- start:235 stop:918 length:684 start_codon:yes stop_codon:yes gene_type:complete
MKKAVILLSGGLDSATTLAIAQNDGFTPYGLTFSYGQRHQFEIGASQKIAEACNLTDHIITEIDLRAFGGSALTDDIDVPKDRSESTMSGSIPVTYVPARNTIFLSFALAWAEVLQSNDIFLGVNSMDYSGYPDCRPEYIQSFQAMANLATKAGVDGDQSITIHTPLISMTKGEIIRKGLALGVDYSLTHSCYDPDKAGNACGRCDSCRIRLKGFQEAGTADPINYT